MENLDDSNYFSYDSDSGESDSGTEICSSREWYEKALNIYGSGGTNNRMETSRILLHGTTSEGKRKILKDGSLHGSKRGTRIPENTPLATLLKGPPAVWFSATLFNGRAPDRSPYGSKQLEFPVQDIVEQLEDDVKLFFEAPLHYGTSVQYVRFVLCSESSKYFNKCSRHLHKISKVKKNPFFYFCDEDMDTFTVHKNYPETPTKIYVDVGVITDEIELTEDVEWGKVEEMNRLNGSWCGLGFA